MVWLLLASLFFYSWWNPLNLPILLCVILINHYAALEVVKQTERKEVARTLMMAVVANLGVLGFFKYFEFFSVVLFDLFGMTVPTWILSMKSDLFADIGLPLGISFFVFQALGYTIDCHRMVIKPEKRLWRTILFVSYFPQLIAGPVVRGKQLLPQLYKRVAFQYDFLLKALPLLCMGLFKKVVVADNMGPISDLFFNDPSGSALDAWLGTLAFSFQIYADFSGYTDMALGAAILFGIKLPQNFDRPYYKSNITDFWRSWNMTLSLWFRDYVYIGLGGSRRGSGIFYRNLILTMLITGLWHGANYTYVVWGAYHGALLVIHKLLKRHLTPGMIPLPMFIKTTITFIMVLIGWVFFRAESMGEALVALNLMFTGEWVPLNITDFGLFIFIPMLMFFEWLGGTKLGLLEKMPKTVYAYCAVLLMMVFLFNSGKSNQFIYFVF